MSQQVKGQRQSATIKKKTFSGTSEREIERWIPVPF